MTALPEMTAKQMSALLLLHRAWHKRAEGPNQITSVQSSDPMVGVNGHLQVLKGCISGFSFGATTIATLKRLGLITRVEWGYRISDAALALMPDPPREEG